MTEKRPRYLVTVVISVKVMFNQKMKYLDRKQEVDFSIPCTSKRVAMRIAKVFVNQGYVDVIDWNIKDDMPIIYCNY